VLASVRTPGPAPDPVTALWKDGLAERIELRCWTEAQTEAVLAAVLGGPVAAGSVRRLWEVSRGNALYLRELLIDAVESGALTEAGGIWALRQPLTAPGRLVELVASRLAGLARARSRWSNCSPPVNRSACRCWRRSPIRSAWRTPKPRGSCWSARTGGGWTPAWLIRCTARRCGVRAPGLSLGTGTEPLTRREREVAGLAAAGASSREIAARLVLSVRTVDNHLQNVYGKLGVTSRDELARVLRG
jgi:DNA-binding CsgD family transcriptional regulator